jgi:hypothetical protein
LLILLRPSNFVGIGGAISDASGFQVKLSKPKAARVLQAYYSVQME